MDLTKANALKMIDQAIISNKKGVINALRKSQVGVASNISDRALSELVINQLNAGNGYLMFHLGKVLDSTLNLNSKSVSSAEGDKKGFFGSIGDFFSKNKDAIGAGASLLGGLFGGGQGQPAQPTAPAGSDQSAILMQMQMAQQQQAAQQAARDRAREQEAADRRRNNLMIA